MAEKALTLRLDEATHERLRREAFEQRLSISDLVREAILEHIAGWDRDDSGPWPVSRQARRNALPARRVSVAELIDPYASEPHVSGDTPM